MCTHRPAPGYRWSHLGQRQPGGADKSQFPQDGSSNRAGVVVVAAEFALRLPGTGCGFAECRRASSTQCGCVPRAPSDVLCASSGTKAVFSP